MADTQVKRMLLDFFFSKMVYYSNVYMTNKSLIYYRKRIK